MINDKTKDLTYRNVITIIGEGINLKVHIDQNLLFILPKDCARNYTVGI